MSFSSFRYDGLHAVVVGGATGMGAATAAIAAEAGATVVVLDVVEVADPRFTFVPVDLRDRASVDTAISRLPDRIDALFSCAGVGDGVLGIEAINFIAHRHMIEALVGSGRLGAGSSVTLISSVAGIGWKANLETLADFLETSDWSEAASWIAAHDNTATYMFSKQAISAYVAREAARLLGTGVRINCILPGPTDTPLAQANAELWLGFGEDYRRSLGLGPMSAEQMGAAMVFLGSRAASGIAGEMLTVDVAQVSSAVSGSRPDAIIDMLLGG